MIVKLTNQEIYTIYATVEQDVMNNDLQLNTSFLWSLDRNQETFRPIVESIEKHRNNILKPFYEQDAFDKENSTSSYLAIKPEFVSEFNEATKQLDELMAIENEVNILTVELNIVPEYLSGKVYKAIRYMIVNE